MAEDAAFIWDSKPAAPRPAPIRPAVVTNPDVPLPVTPQVKWVTLREAADDTGLAVATIRNWARKKRVPSRMEDRPEGPRRLVGLEEVRERAATRQMPAARSPAPAPRAGARPGDAAPVPDGHLLVPLDAWEKVLAQLGNLHEAGQQLADARERAAKAETEAAFLRERLAEMRERAGGQAPVSEVSHQATAEAPAKAPPTLRETAASWYHRLTARRR